MTAPLIAEDGSAQVALRPGATLDQYVVLGQLGSGGAGDVYLAWDTRLDRRIALKVLHDREGRNAATRQGREFRRLVSEARLVAKLAHPNVVTVFDVREVDGRAFIAMEYIDGTDLATFLAGPPREWTELLRIFVEAGRGIVAAHAAGIVHGDFKPANVLLGKDGRPRVSDFGVARTIAEDDASSPDDPVQGPWHGAGLASGSGSGPRSASASGSASDAGPRSVAAGTPYYMAPEQHAGDAATVASDVYAFCLSLWQALHGTPPFDAETLGALEAAKREGPPALRSRTRSVPRSVTETLARGLEPDPARRPARLSEVLDALTRAPARRRRWLVGATGGVALAAMATIAAAAGAGEDPCSGGTNEFEQVWNDARRQQLAQRFTDYEGGFATDSWRRVEGAVDAYAASWATQHEHGCRAALRGERSTELLDLGMACLQRQQMELDAVLGRLAGGGSDAVTRAVPAVTALREPSWCGDTERLLDRAGWDTPPRTPEVVAIEQLLAEASSHRRTGTFADGLALADEATTRAEGIGHRHLWVEGLYAGGTLEHSLGHFDRAEAHYKRATWEAEAIGHDDVAAWAAAQLVMVVGYELERHADGLTWALHADAAVRRAGSEPRLVGRLATNESAVLKAKGDYAAAHDKASRAVETLESVGGQDLASALDNLANAAMSIREGEQARAHGERALAAWQDLLGPDHPAVANTLGNLADTLMRLDDVEGGLAYAERAVEIAERGLAPDHPKVAQLSVNLANLEALAGHEQEALRTYKRALELYRAQDPRHRHVGSVAYNLGMLLLHLEELETAREHFVLSLDVWEEVLGKDHPQLVSVLIALGAVEHQLGNAADAIAPLERAVALAAAGPADPLILGDAQFELAQALRLADRDRDRAIQLARDAQALFAGSDPADAERSTAAQNWLHNQGA